MQEIEAKFYISDLSKVQQNLTALGAHLLEPRVLEINLRFDTPENKFLQERRVLRLRKDREAHLTYKDDARLDNGAQVRREIEFDVSDYDSARQFLEVLGYKVVVIYEKYRTVYEMDGTEIMLDELPFGNFCEIEGKDVNILQKVAQALGLNWQNSIPISYLALFDSLQNRKSLKVDHLTFQAFEGLTISATDLEVIPADQP